MGKAVGLLPSWYWPEGVQRYVAAPPVSIYDLTVGRWARRYGDDPALMTAAGTITFRDLDTGCSLVAAALAERFPDDPPRVALAVEGGAAFPQLFLGALRASCAVLVLPGADDDALAAFAPDLVVSALPGVQGEHPEALLAAGPSSHGRPPRVDATRPLVALPGSAGLAWHSHQSLMSAAMAFAAFVEVEAGGGLCCVQAPGSWEGLIGLLAPLQAGAPAIAVEQGDWEGVAAVVRRDRPRVVWLNSTEGERLLASADPLSAALSQVRPTVYLTATGPFPRHRRRALRHRLRSHVLTVYGYPECGAIAADHASWYLEEASGIPMVGVDILALNPETGQPSELPWQVLSHARIGARSQAVATNQRTAPPSEQEKPEAAWYTTGDDGIVDGNGVLFLLPP